MFVPDVVYRRFSGHVRLVAGFDDDDPAPTGPVDAEIRGHDRYSANGDAEQVSKYSQFWQSALVSVWRTSRVVVDVGYADTGNGKMYCRVYECCGSRCSVERKE